MPHFYSDDVVDQALSALAQGTTLREVSRDLAVPPKTVRRWQQQYAELGLRRGQQHCQAPCPVCGPGALDEAAYSELLGWYLGDGHIARFRSGIWCLRIYNDIQYTEDNKALLALLARVKPGGRPTASARGKMIISYVYWKHWLCLFPQHGPGLKHTRRIELEPWQEHLVTRHPGPFLRGLFHSDGCRAANWTRRKVAGEMKRYDYPRWQFSNRSQDIRALCCWALDLVEIPWRQSNRWIISVSQREAVARLDALIGPKQ